jgi:toxin CcdB
MARFDVYRQADGTLLLDCQADILSGLNTRFVVPLLPPERAPRAADRLNPVFTVERETMVMYTQFAGSIAARDLGEPILSMADQHIAITNALDMLLSGY